MLRTRLSFVLFFLTCFTSFFMGCSSKKVDPEHSGAFFGDSVVHRFELKNGLKILVIENHTAPTFAYQTWFKVGSKDEVQGLTGLAHLFEHMMFKGTKNRKEGEFDKLLEEAGAEGENAFTSNDYTGYVQALPSDKLNLIAELEAERMVNLIVSDESLDKEREVVQNERRFRNENNPNGMLFEKLGELSYSKHPYHWPVIGYEADLKAAKQKQCEDFYKKYYAPNNATIVIVGDVNPSAAYKTIEKYYSHLPSSEIVRRNFEMDGFEPKEKSYSVKIKSPVEKLLISYPSVDIKHADFAALEVLRGVLAVGKSSRLHKALVNKGIASEIEIENEEKEHRGRFILFANLQKNKRSSTALNEIDRELAKIKIGKISQEEIDRAVALLKLTLFDSLESNYKRAQFVGYYETIAGNYSHGMEIVDSFSKITPADLSRVATTYFKTRYRISVIGLASK